MSATAERVTRFRRSSPCPICGGGDDMPRGRAQRCSGYLSSDGRFAYCTREEYAGQARLEDTEPVSYRHILEGECRCGVTHREAPPRVDSGRNGSARRIVATYPYVDAAGVLLFEVVRYDPKGFKQRRPDGHGGWIWEVKGAVRLVLYQLPKVLEIAAVAETIYVVAGEKDVHAIEDAGGWATTNPGGEGKWRSEYSDALKGAKVVIVADNDAAGIAHARRVAETLPAATTTIVKAAVGNDASDHLAAGKALADLEPLEDEPGGAPAVPEARIEWERLSEVEMRSIVFRDKPLLQADAFHLLTGRKGMGKGTLLAHTAARVTRGELGEHRNVIWIGSEDSVSIDIKPRIVAAGGDPARVLVVKSGWIEFPKDIDELEQAMTDLGEVGMVAIDPVGNHIAGKDSNSDSDIRAAIAPLNQLADRHKSMVFGVRHLSEKECAKGVLAAILGSSAWVQVPRAVLAVVRDDEDPQVSHIQCVAGNRQAAGTPGRMFRIEGVLLPGLENEVTRATWIGDSTKDVATMLAGNTKANAAREPSRSAVARELILDTLDQVVHMESDALDALISEQTGVAVKTVKNQRSKLKDDGLIRVYPDKDQDGAILRWLCSRTLAPRTRHPANPDPDQLQTLP